MAKKNKPWISWYYNDFLDGIIGMDASEVGVYSFLLNMIYDHDGPLPANDRAYRIYAHRLKMRIDHFQRVLKSLTDLHKIIIADGVMSNSRADLEIDERSRRVARLAGNLRGGGAKNGRDLSETGLKAARDLSETGLKVVSKNGVDDKKSSKNNGGSEILGPYNNSNNNSNRDRQPPRKMPKATRIDPRLKLSDANKVFARSRGLTPKEIEHEWMVFVRYYAQRDDRQPNARSMDWNSVWESWVLKKAHELNREPLVDGEYHNGKADPANLPREVWERTVEMWMKSGWWSVEDFGPEPGQPGCRAPADLVRPS